MPTLTSILAVKLVNGLSGPAAKASASLKSLGRDAKALAKIDVFKAQSRKLDEYSLALKRANQNLHAQKKALEAADKPSARLQGSYERAVRAADAAKAAFLRQGQAVRATRADLASAGIAVNRLASEENRLRAAIERTTAAHRRQEAAVARRSRRRAALGEAGALIAGYAGHKIAQGLHNALDITREYDKERRFGKAVMGLTDEQQRPLVAQAIHGGATTKYNDIQFLEAQRELAARGLGKKSILGIMPSAANLGMATGQSLPDAVKQMEGAIFGFAKNISSVEDAVKSATQTADVIVKAMKVSGMTPEDIQQLYKFGATPSRLAGVSEQTLLAFGGISKKANMGGDESGTAYRALMSAALSPTQGARTALRAAGIDHSSFQTMKDHIEVKPFVKNIAEKYGINLGKGAQAALGKVFNDKDTLADPSRFAPAVMQALRGSLGGKDAKSLKSIAGEARRYRQASVEGFDTNGFLQALMKALPGNLQLSNAIFGSKQGGRIANALGNPEVMRRMVDEINNSAGFAKSIADELMAGLDGAMSRLEGSLKNLGTAIGRAFDNSGEGNGGMLTKLTDSSAKLVQGFAELNGTVLAAGTTVAAVFGLGGAAATGAKIVGGLLGASALTGVAGAAGSKAMSIGLSAGTVVLTAAVLEMMDPKGNFGGLTSGIDNTLRKWLGARPSDTGITPGEIWEGVKRKWNNEPDEAPGRGASGSWGPPKVEKQGMFGDVNIHAPITINEAADGKAAASEVTKQLDSRIKDAFQRIQGDVGFSYG